MPRTAEQVRMELLVLQAQDGERCALEQLVAMFHLRLLRHARHLSGRDDIAHDVVQESWLAVVRGIRRLDDPATFRAWVYRIVTNKCADHVRSRVRERQTLQERVPPTIENTDLGDEELLQLGMTRLGPDQRAILSLRYLEDMSTREIAHVLGVPDGTVKSRLHQARNELKSLLERSIS